MSSAAATRRAAEALSGPPGVALVVLTAVAAFWLGLVSLGEAWSTPEYSHGPLIPLISGYLFLRQMRDDARPIEPAPLRWPGVAVGALALLIAGAGVMTRIPDIVTYGMILWIYGLILTSFGWRRGRDYWPPVVHLGFMLPLPNMLYWKLSIWLQGISSELGVALIRAMEIPVFLDGNIIDLGDMKLHVAEACSGLRYLFPIMSFSYVFAVLYQGSFWLKAVMLLSAAPITVVMNSVRIGVIGIVADRYGVIPAEDFQHYLEGWIVFIASIGLMLLIAAILRRIAGDRRPFSTTLDLDTRGVGATGLRVLNGRWTPALAAFGAMTALVALAFHFSITRSEAPADRRIFDVYPGRISEWTGRRATLDAEVAAVLKADDYLSAAYRAPGEPAVVDLFAAYYERMLGGAGVHSPEVCLPSAGWEMSEIRKASFEYAGPDGPVTVAVNRAIIQKGSRRQIVYYWFDQGGRRLTSDYRAKAWAMIDAVTRGRSDGGLVRAITPIAIGETDADAEERLRRFLREAAPLLSAHLPN